MGQNSYSEELKEFQGPIENQALISSLQAFASFLNYSSLPLYEWEGNLIAILLEIPVELPPLGNYEGIDIRDPEPVIVLFNKQLYPTKAPQVYSNRRDFPKSLLPHLYFAKPENPSAICLTRGSIDEWYSNKEPKDLIIRLQNWFRDASTGELVNNGNQFDPLRMEGYFGIAIYDYNMLFKIVSDRNSFFQECNFAVGLFEVNFDNGKLITQYKKTFHESSFDEEIIELSKTAIQEKEPHKKARYPYAGFILWSPTDINYDDYNVKLPQTWNDLTEFTINHGINLKELEDFLLYRKQTGIITLVIGIRRSRNIIGFSGNIEFLTFSIIANEQTFQDDKVVGDTEVSIQKHLQPLTYAKAKEISGFTYDFQKSNLIAGCGALGSKIILHFVRSGITNLVLADPDDLYPHNLVRNGLLPNAIGINKAVALEREIKNIYPFEDTSNVFAVPGIAEIFIQHSIIQYVSKVFDFTASNQFANTLINARLPENTLVTRCYLSDKGNIGILLQEGEGRNPRIDDLELFLYNSAKCHKEISEWLKRELEGSITQDITVGIGCNTETTVLSDHIVGLHAAYFMGIITTEASKNNNSKGAIFTNILTNNPVFKSHNNFFQVEPFDVFQAVNNPKWQIRFKHGLIDILKQNMKEAFPLETGGVFIGRANYKTNTLHVTDIIAAPPDSTANPICFIRGIEGLPEQINEVLDVSGNQLGYIGEWHTHPKGPNWLSVTDLNTVKKFKDEFQHLQSPLPVFIMILTPERVLPFIF